MTDKITDKGDSKPSKASGKFHQLKGDLKVSLGRAFGAPEMQQSGVQERTAGYAEYQAAAGQGSYGQGTKERITGECDQVVGSVTADGAQQTRGDQLHAQGTAQQEWNRSL